MTTYLSKSRRYKVQTLLLLNTPVNMIAAQTGLSIEEINSVKVKQNGTGTKEKQDQGNDRN